MIKGPCSSSTVDETDTPLVLGKEKTVIPSPTLSRGANGLGGLPVSLAVAIEVSFSLLYHPPRHAPVAREFDYARYTPSPHGRTRMIVFPLIRLVWLKAATASSRVETLPMFVRSRPSRTRWTISLSWARSDSTTKSI